MAAGGDYAELAVFLGQIMKVNLNAHDLMFSCFGLICLCLAKAEMVTFLCLRFHFIASCLEVGS